MNRPTIYRTEEGETPQLVVPAPATTAAEQMLELEGDLRRTEGDFLTLPFPSLAAIVGGVPHGELWYVGAFSGDGKTAFFTSLTLALIELGLKVYYVPTETPGRVIRAHVACKALGYDVGDFLSGAFLQWPDAKLARSRVVQEARKYASPFVTGNKDEHQKLWIAESGFLTPFRIHAEADIANEMGADLVIWDHGDHTEDSGFETSVSTQKAILTGTQTYGLRSFVSTQFNLDAVKGNRTLRYMAPQPNYVYMGNIKRQLCDGMLAVRRCVKRSNLNLDQLKAFRKGDQSVQASDILEPNTMVVDCMKHRKYGQREGQRAYLHVHHGRVQEFTAREQEIIEHQLPTHKRDLFEGLR